MAAGDLTIFDEAKAYMIDGGWEASDNMAINIIRAVSTPTASDTTPSPTDYTLATTVEGEQVIATLGTMVTQTGGTVDISDPDPNISWVKNAGNSTDARWAIIFNTTQAGDPALAFIDLGANVNLITHDLTLTW